MQPFHICAWQAQPVSILDIAKRDLKAVLAAASMHTAYYHASRSARKDLTASQHCLDFPSTGSAKRMCVNTSFATQLLLDVSPQTMQLWLAKVAALVGESSTSTVYQVCQPPNHSHEPIPVAEKNTIPQCYILLAAGPFQNGVGFPRLLSLGKLALLLIQS